MRTSIVNRPGAAEESQPGEQETGGATDMNEETDTQSGTETESQPKPETTPTEPNTSMPSQDVGWARASTSQVIRTVAVALLTTAVVLGALFLLWQVHTFIGWLVIALFLAAVLNPAVNWLSADTGS